MAAGQRSKDSLNLTKSSPSSANRFVTRVLPCLDELSPITKDQLISTVHIESRSKSSCDLLIEAHFGIDVVTPQEQLTQLYDSIFDKFDSNQSGTVDLEEFRKEMKKIMLAIADGLGSSPIQMVLEDDD
ncbi:hypothetical protein ACFX13_013895 [Malus domestica]